MAGLEALDALDHGVVMRPGVLVAGDVAAHQQPLAQEIVMRALLAEGEFGVCGNGWPAAAHGDVGIAEGCFPDPLRGAFVISWLMRQSERGGGALLRRRSRR